MESQIRYEALKILCMVKNVYLNILIIQLKSKLLFRTLKMILMIIKKTTVEEMTSLSLVSQ